MVVLVIFLQMHMKMEFYIFILESCVYGLADEFLDRISKIKFKF